MRYPIRGVTLIELIMVLVVISVLSVTAMISFSALSQHKVVVRADEFRRAISHAQLLAISQSVRLQLATTPSGYSIRICSEADCSTSTPAMTDPATGGAFSVDLSGENVTLSVGTIDFDSMGRPQSGGALLFVEPTPFCFKDAGNSVFVSISVLPITGFALAREVVSC